MKTGIELIAQERTEQIEKHGRTVKQDVCNNNEYQLSGAASMLALIDWVCLDEEDIIQDHCPDGWDEPFGARWLRSPTKNA